MKLKGSFFYESVGVAISNALLAKKLRLILPEQVTERDDALSRAQVHGAGTMVEAAVEAVYQMPGGSAAIRELAEWLVEAAARQTAEVVFGSAMDAKGEIINRGGRFVTRFFTTNTKHTAPLLNLSLESRISRRVRNARLLPWRREEKEANTRSRSLPGFSCHEPRFEARATLLNCTETAAHGPASVTVCLYDF